MQKRGYLVSRGARRFLWPIVDQELGRNARSCHRGGGEGAASVRTCGSSKDFQLYFDRGSDRNAPALMLMRGCKRALVETDLLRGAIDLLLSFVCLFVFINKEIPGAG